MKHSDLREFITFLEQRGELKRITAQVDPHLEITEICDSHGMNAHFGVQEEARGTAHAVACAGDHLAGEGIVVFADTLFGEVPTVQGSVEPPCSVVIEQVVIRILRVDPKT